MGVAEVASSVSDLLKRLMKEEYVNEGITHPTPEVLQYHCNYRGAPALIPQFISTKIMRAILIKAHYLTFL